MEERHSWLEKLELDSWQAELIISGIAIYGSLQLPALIERGVNRGIITLGDAYQEPLYYVFWYLLLAATIFIVCFIGHLILRSLWIGLVGLASVFPNGINLNASKYSRDYLEKAAADFGNIRDFNKRLDELCSLVFALTFGFAFTLIAFAVQMSIGLLLAGILAKFFPTISLIQFFLGYLILMFLPAFAGSFLGLPSMREKAWVQRVHYPVFTKFFGGLVFLFFFRPVTFINLVLYTNLKTQRLFGIFGGFFVISMVLGTSFLMQSNAPLFMDDPFFRYAQRSDKVLPRYYADANNAAFQIVPELESDVLRDPLIRLFVPILGRDETYLNRLCGTYTDDPEMTEEENLQAARDFRTGCLSKYITVYIDGAPVEPASLIKSEHPRGNTPGALLYLVADSLAAGQHVLQVEYAHTNEEGRKRRANIPFFYNPN